MTNKKGLYIHIPFCKNKCPYCVFQTIETNNKELVTTYIDYLISEIEKLDSHKFDTIYLGGGTPNYLSNFDLERLLISLDKFNVLEYTIELNPEYITIEQLKILKNHHINRVSIGVQSFNKLALKSLNRYYEFRKIKELVRLIKNELTPNISLDLIFNYPYQKLIDIKNDVRKVLKLKVPHLSIYDLIYEDNSHLTNLVRHKKIAINDEKISFLGYKYIINKLVKKGFGHYEISSFAKQDYQSIHNLKYWEDKEYLALGLGASSYLNNNEITNARQLNKLYQNIKKVNKLSEFEQMSRYMFMGLRKLDGINPQDFYIKFNKQISVVFNISDLINNKLIKYNDDVIKLTNKGLFLANQVFEVFI